MGAAHRRNRNRNKGLSTSLAHGALPGPAAKARSRPARARGRSVFTSAPGGNVLQIQTEGTIEDNNAKFTESGTAEWDAAKKTLAFKETVANGTTLSGVGDWSSPLAIRYESEPARAGTQNVRIRRTYSILSAQSFSVAEEISIDGGPFQRLGNGVFQKN